MEDIILVMVFLENMCFVVLGFMDTEGQKTERFLRARKPTKLLVGWEDFVVSFWEIGKKIILRSIFLVLIGIANGHLQHTREEVFHLVYFVMFLFKYFNHKVNFLLISSSYLDFYIWIQILNI